MSYLFCVNYNYDSADFLSKAEDIKGYCEKYDVCVGAIGRWGMERIDEKKWDVEIAYQYTKRNQVTYYFIDENKLIVIRPTFELTDNQMFMIIEEFKELQIIGNPLFQ